MMDCVELLHLPVLWACRLSACVLHVHRGGEDASERPLNQGHKELEGWLLLTTVKSPRCSSRGHGLNSQHTHGSPHMSVKSFWHPHTYIHADKTPMNLKIWAIFLNYKVHSKLRHYQTFKLLFFYFYNTCSKIV